MRCRKKDDDAVKKAAEKAREEYKKNIGKDIEVQVDGKERVPEGS